MDDTYSDKYGPHFGWTFRKIREFVIEKPLMKGDKVLIYNDYRLNHNYELGVVAGAEIGRRKMVSVEFKNDYGRGNLFF